MWATNLRMAWMGSCFTRIMWNVMVWRQFASFAERKRSSCLTFRNTRPLFPCWCGPVLLKWKCITHHVSGNWGWIKNPLKLRGQERSFLRRLGCGTVWHLLSTGWRCTCEQFTELSAACVSSCLVPVRLVRNSELKDWLPFNSWVWIWIEMTGRGIYWIKVLKCLWITCNTSNAFWEISCSSTLITKVNLVNMIKMS